MLILTWSFRVAWPEFHTMGGIMALCWAIWKTQNKMCFKRKPKHNPVEIICYSYVLMRYWADLYLEDNKETLIAGMNTMLCKMPRSFWAKRQRMQEGNSWRERSPEGWPSRFQWPRLMLLWSRWDSHESRVASGSMLLLACFVIYVMEGGWSLLCLVKCDVYVMLHCLFVPSESDVLSSSR